MLSFTAACGNHGEVVRGEESLRPSSSQRSPEVDRVVEDLRVYIPGRMESEGVPGLEIALIHEGGIVWEAAFGVANALTGDPVRPDSVFEVESIGKPVAAYAALTLVNSGALALDEPINGYLDRPWLPQSEWSDEITLRQLLSHTSGLSNRLYPLDKTIRFEPGERFAYSNVGYQYLQAVIEDVAGSPLEQVASDTTFAPMGMSSSTFADRSDVTSQLVFGHINYGALLAPLVAVLLLWFTLIVMLGAAAQRIRTQRFGLTWGILGICYAVAAVLSLPVVAWLNGGINKWSFFHALTIAVLSFWLAAWVAGTQLVTRRLPERWRSKRRLRVLSVMSVVCGLAVFALLANAISGPVPKGPSATPGAAYSLKSTAGDLARFMIELSNPQHLSPSTAAEMLTPQVGTSTTNSWGLGIAVYDGPDCDWLWHAGDGADFHALMVMCPRTGDGVVVLTNGESGQFVTQDIAGRAMRVDFAWSRR
ncbi:MAG: serine hydrolase domain-containing protein [Acidimicrobiales bacterium]